MAVSWRAWCFLPGRPPSSAWFHTRIQSPLAGLDCNAGALCGSPRDLETARTFFLSYKKYTLYFFSPLGRRDTVAGRQYIFASKDGRMRGYVSSWGFHVVFVSRWNMLLETAQPSGKLGNGDFNWACVLRLHSYRCYGVHESTRQKKGKWRRMAY